MTQQITVEGDLATVDVATGLTTQGSVAVPSRQVPMGMSMVKDILIAVAHDSAAAGSAVFALRLGGVAVQKGEQVIVIAGAGNIAVQAGSDQAPNVGLLETLRDVDIEVTPGDTINIQGEMDGSDLGTARMVVTLVFA